MTICVQAPRPPARDALSFCMCDWAKYQFQSLLFAFAKGLFVSRVWTPPGVLFTPFTQQISCIHTNTNTHAHTNPRTRFTYLWRCTRCAHLYTQTRTARVVWDWKCSMWMGVCTSVILAAAVAEWLRVCRTDEGRLYCSPFGTSVLLVGVLRGWVCVCVCFFL